jgi:alpha-tubulin suppressor-like RCC1 family protein
MYQFGFGHKQLRSDSFIGHSNIDNLDIVTLYVGGWHNFAKTKNEQFYGWGYDMGRLGTGTSNGHCQMPTLLPFEKYNFSKLIPGWWHSMGLSHNGDLYAWGHGTEGSLGQGTLNTIPVPTLIITNVKDAFTGKDIVNNMAVKNG